ncbi:MAG: hypothetical protein IJ523_06275 [Succinivibrionaceae bacterium]|nr:hypothetical protein [Succinivibrionaceae bacterium]
MNRLLKTLALGLLPSAILAQNTGFVASPDGWSIVSQQPCDQFIIFQNNQIRDSNFIYYVVANHETIAVSDISDVITSKMKCLNPEVKKSGIGALQVTCANDMIINVWESTANYNGQDIPIYSSIILKNMNRELIRHELPKLVQTAMIYQDLALDAIYKGRCGGDTHEPKLPSESSSG